ncbi:unnamed protein product [Alternaria burnsii]|nr:unnamed protein product [Alternaria burnsii]
MRSKSTAPHQRFFIRPAARKSAGRSRPSLWKTYFYKLLERHPGGLQSNDHSASMSSITPQSFVDDGGSFTKREPRGLDQRHVASWIASNKSEISGYTGSFIDDGADMQLPPGVAPGFGPVDTRFYKQKKRKEARDGVETVWNDDVQKAISGDIQRNLEKIKGLGGLEVKRTDHDGCQDKKPGDQEKANKDTVTVPVPPQWGTFVIKADDGRVIVVDKDGEFDSGPQKALSEQPKHWVKAASTVESASLAKGAVPHSTTMQRTSSRQTKERSKEKKQKSGSGKSVKNNRSRRSHLSSPKTLTPISESEYEEGYLHSGGEDMGSPTGFMMTGGASGWPSSRATSVSVSDAYEYIVPGSPIKAISEGFRYVRPRSQGYKDIIPALNSWIEKKASPMRSPPTRRPPPDILPVKGDTTVLSEASWGGGQFESAWKVASPSHSCKSHRSTHTSNKSPKFKNDSDSASGKSHATYKAPTVEDALGEEDHIATGWVGSVKSTGKQGWGRDQNSNAKSSSSKKEEREPAWTSSANTPHPHTWAGAGSRSSSERSWSKRPKSTDNASWTGVESPTFQHIANSPTSVHFGSPTLPLGDTTWDGLERNKSTSEVGVVDTGSERASLGRQSRVSSLRSARRSHGSHDTHRSHRSSKHVHPTCWEDGQAGWAGGSQASHLSRHSQRPDDAAIWPDSRAVSEQSWSSQKARVDDDSGGQWGGADQDVGKYANGYDEDNATYLNDSWNGVPVRVGGRAGSRSPRQSSAATGWV